MDPGVPLRHRPRLPWWLMGAVLAAGILCHLRVGGTSPILWNDTVYEEREVQACLRSNSCTPLGTTASILGISFASGWLAIRDALGWLGLGLDGTHVLIQVLRGISVLLVATAAFRASGLTAAALAVILGSSGTVSFDASRLLPVFSDGTLQTALYNVAILPFLGTLLLLLCLLALEEQGRAALLLAAMTAAVMANVHVAAASAGISVVAIALCRRRGRWRWATLAGLAFVGAAFAIAPAAWLHDLAELRRSFNAAPGPGASHGAAPPVEPLVLLSLLPAACAFVLLLKGGPRARLRSGVIAAVALAMPPLVAAVAVGQLGVAKVETRYYGYLAPTLGFLAAIVVATAIRAIAGRALIRDEGDRAQFRVLDRSALIGACLFLAFVPGPGEAALLPRLRARTIREVAAPINAGGRWSWPALFRGLKTPYTQDALQLIAVDFPSWPSPIAAPNEPNSILLLAVPSARIPAQLPGGIKRLASDEAWSGLVAPTRTGLDWSSFEVCVVEKSGFTRCEPSGLEPSAGEDVTGPSVRLRGMPATSELPHLQKLVMKMRWRRTAGRDEALYMPRLADVCGGRITAVGGDGTISVDGRAALVRADGEVILEWELGTSDCPASSYSEFPPFFLAGEPEVVGFLASLNGHEGRI